MEYMIKALGIKQVNTKFERMGIASIDAKPAMETVADLMFKIFYQIFESQGRRGGGSWKRDSTEWLLRKQRAGLDPRIGHASLALRRAMSIRGEANQNLEVTHNLVHLSTDLPYAATEQRHRPFIKFTKRDKLEMRRIVRDFLMGAFRA